MGREGMRKAGRERLGEREAGKVEAAVENPSPRGLPLDTGSC